MWHVGEASHLVNQVHHTLSTLKWRQGSRDEQADDLTLRRLRLLADDGELRGEPREGERSHDSVVISERDAIEATNAAALDQCLERCPAVMRVARMKVKVYPQRNEARGRLDREGFSKLALARLCKQGINLAGPGPRQSFSNRAPFAS